MVYPRVDYNRSKGIYTRRNGGIPSFYWNVEGMVWRGKGIRRRRGKGKKKRSINERFETYGAIYRTIAIQSEMEMYPGLGDRAASPI